MDANDDVLYGTRTINAHDINNKNKSNLLSDGLTIVDASKFVLPERKPWSVYDKGAI